MKKIIVLGNSITRHGEAPHIGWYLDCGMAASEPDKDFVHILGKMIAPNELTGVNMSSLERGWWEVNLLKDNDDVKNAVDYNADVVIFRIAENVDVSKANDYKKTLYEGFCDICDLFSENGAKIIMTTPFWENEILVNTISKIAFDRNYPLVKLHDLGSLAQMRADGLFEHAGVAAHPGDLGMLNIAQRIYCELNKII